MHGFPIYKKIWIIFALTCLNGFVFAQPSELPFEHLTITDGLPSHDLTAVIQDHLGFLWLGSQEGLIRYDGYESVHYMPELEDSTSISGAAAFFLFEDSTGDIWVGTEDCLDRFDRETETFTCIVELEAPVWRGRHRIAENTDGTIWVGTPTGLVSIDRESGAVLNRYLPQPEGVVGLSYNSENNITVVQEDKTGALWVGTEGGGLSRFDRKDNTFHSISLGGEEDTEYQFRPLSSRYINDILEGPEGDLWIATDCGLYRIDLSSMQPLSVSPPAARNSEYQCFDVFNLNIDNRQTVWATPGGEYIYHYDRKKASLIGHRIVTEKSIIGGASQLIEDRFGVFWLAALSGLYKMNPAVQFFSTLQAEIDSLTISAIYQDSMGAIWAGTWQGTLLQLDKDAGFLTPHMVFPGNAITHMAEDFRGALWVPVRNHGVFRVEPDRTTFTQFTFVSGYSGSRGNINKMLVDSDGIVWAATYGDGLHRFNAESQTFSPYKYVRDDPYSLPSNYIISLYEDRFGILWLGLENGVSRFDKESEQFRFFDIPRANSMAEDSSGRFWVATIDGLYLLDRESGATTVYKTEDGLPNNIGRSVVVDDDGYLWIGTANGLSRFDPVSQTFTNYSSADGISSDTFGEDDGFKAADGELFFVGSEDGRVTAFFPEQIPVNTSKPEVVFTSFKIRGEEVMVGKESPLNNSLLLTDHIRIPYEDRDISFSFAALHFERPELNRYAYMLEGYDDSYSTPGLQRTATYTNLDPDDYVLRVKAANRNGVWNEEGASIAITVLPPLWRTTGAYILYGLVFITGVAAFDRFRHRRLIARERESAHIRESRLLAEAAEERARLAEQLDQTKSRFFVNLSHEFRTPLTMLLGPIRDALDGTYGSVSERFNRQLAAMQRNGERLHRLINQLLDLARLEAGGLHLQAREGDLAAFVRALTLSFASRAEREQKTLLFEAQPDALTVYFDRDKLEKVVFNLLSNAFKFTPAHGKIRVVVDEHEGAARITVSDTGEGIPADELPHIFDRFHQADTSATRRHEGSGIGLSLAKELVELHGGAIEVESSEGFGSAFTVTLPLGRAHLLEEDLIAEEDDPVATVEEQYETFIDGDDDPVERAVDEASGENLATILIVEDNVDVRAYLRSHLGGYLIVEAEDGEEGLEKALAQPPDLVISDVMMPKMDGYALCAALKRERKTQDIPVVLLTAKAAEENKIEGLASGADDYLYKPFSARELMARTENLIEQRRRLRSQYSGEVVLKPADIAVSSADAVFIEKVRALIEEHMGDSRFGVERLAEEIGVSRRQLQRRMSELTEISTQAFIREMRLERAAQLLEQGAGNVSEVAYAVGFRDPRHFSRLFKQKYGTSPSKWKSEASQGCALRHNTWINLPWQEFP